LIVETCNCLFYPVAFIWRDKRYTVTKIIGT
ncbi:unnamed protein product, partial [marine sediment metagenome]